MKRVFINGVLSGSSAPRSLAKAMVCGLASNMMSLWEGMMDRKFPFLFAPCNCILISTCAYRAVSKGSDTSRVNQTLGRSYAQTVLRLGIFQLRR